MAGFEKALTRVTSIAKGSLEEAAMAISIRKSQVIHRITRVSANTEADVASFNLNTNAAHAPERSSSAAGEFTCKGGVTMTYAALTTRHIDGQNSENRQETCG